MSAAPSVATVIFLNKDDVVPELSLMVTRLPATLRLLDSVTVTLASVVSTRQNPSGPLKSMVWDVEMEVTEG